MKYAAIAKKVLTLRSQAQSMVALSEDILEAIAPLVEEEERKEQEGGDRPMPRTFGQRRES